MSEGLAEMTSKGGRKGAKGVGCGLGTSGVIPSNGSARQMRARMLDVWMTFLSWFKTHCTSKLKPPVKEEGGGGDGGEKVKLV